MSMKMENELKDLFDKVQEKERGEGECWQNISIFLQNKCT